MRVSEKWLLRCNILFLTCKTRCIIIIIDSFNNTKQIKNKNTKCRLILVFWIDILVFWFIYNKKKYRNDLYIVKIEKHKRLIKCIAFSNL